MGKPHSIVAIGASVGGVEAMSALTAALPADFGAAVFIVLHIGAHRSELPWLLSQTGPLPASHARDGDAIRPGQIYIAPPDHHLVLEPGRIRLTRGPRENWARPAVDPLFRSTAQAYGPEVVGIVLSGGLNDGTAGLYEIAQRGGTTVVQDPADAINPSMPRSALKHVTIDHCLPIAHIPELLVNLVTSEAAKASETLPAIMTEQAMAAEYTFDHPVAVTCPDCGGALRRTELGTLIQFRCHIGHVYTAEVMVAAQFAGREWSLGAAMRALSERSEMCRQMAVQAAGDGALAAEWASALQEAKERMSLLRDILDSEWRHPGNTEPHGPWSG